MDSTINKQRKSRWLGVVLLITSIIFAVGVSAFFNWDFVRAKVADYFYYRGVQYYQTSDYNQAEIYFGKSLSVNNSVASNKRTYDKLSDTLERLGRINERDKVKRVYSQIETAEFLCRAHDIGCKSAMMAPPPKDGRLVPIWIVCGIAFCVIYSLFLRQPLTLLGLSIATFFIVLANLFAGLGFMSKMYSFQYDLYFALHFGIIIFLCLRILGAVGGPGVVLIISYSFLVETLPLLVYYIMYRY